MKSYGALLHHNEELSQQNAANSKLKLKYKALEKCDLIKS